MILRKTNYYFFCLKISVKTFRLCNAQKKVCQLQNFRNFQFTLSPLSASRQPCLRQLPEQVDRVPEGQCRAVGQMVGISDTNPFSRSAGPESPTWEIEPQRAGKPLLRNADSGQQLADRGGNAAGGESWREPTRLWDLFWLSPAS